MYASWLFFFSSRRRHTRSLRDWSSDVCSSDLTAVQQDFPEDAALIKAFVRGINLHIARVRMGQVAPPAEMAPSALNFQPTRSEERRVGKECRSRWWREH